MTWLVALAYLGSGLLLWLALSRQIDPRVRRLLGLGPSSSKQRRPPKHRARGMTRPRSADGPNQVEVPELLDLLAVAVSAGLSPRLALDRAPSLLRGRIGSILEEVREEVALGAPWHVALESSAERSRLPELRRLAVTLRRADRLGAPVAERLRELALQVRSERRLRREERARRAPVQMLFPLVFLILPAFVIAGVVPALIVATRGLV